MKKSAIPVLIAVGLFTAGSMQAQQKSKPAKVEWRTLISATELAKYAGGELYAVEFLNHNVGWALGGHASATLLFRTTDGGKSWERQPLFDGEQHVPDLNDIGFADANNGWIVGKHHILRTSDGGESWEPVDYGKSAPWATSLLVLSPDAIIFGSGVERKQIVRTVDGGKSWTPIALYNRSGPRVSALAYSPSNQAVFATVGASHGSSGALHRSNDGGLTWEMVAEADKPLFDVAFHGRNGVAVGSNIAYWTNDGGETWRRTTIPGIQSGVDFINETTVVAVGSRPHVVVSENGGKTWQPIAGPPGVTGTLTDIDVVDAGWWFVSGGYGAKSLYQFVDHEYIGTIDRGLLPIPVDVVAGGDTLPRGVYEVVLGHQGDKHVLMLEREGDVPKDTQLSGELDKYADQQEKQTPPNCLDPCAAIFPIDVTYEKEELANGKDPRSLLKLMLQPTANGVAIVLHTAVTPPRNLAIAMAAAGVQANTNANVREAAGKAKQGGGLLDRVKKAAAGDVKGATEGFNPQSVAERGQAAKAAVPAVYEISLRYPIALFSRKRAGN